MNVSLAVYLQVTVLLCLTAEAHVPTLSKEYIGMMEYKKEDEERIIQNLILGILVTLQILSVVNDIHCRTLEQKIQGAVFCLCSKLPFFHSLTTHTTWRLYIALFLLPVISNIEVLFLRKIICLTLHNADSIIFLIVYSLIKL